MSDAAIQLLQQVLAKVDQIQKDVADLKKDVSRIDGTTLVTQEQVARLSEDVTLIKSEVRGQKV
jgi:peptidoglycan hydrolase CwlO-like protein